MRYAIGVEIQDKKSKNKYNGLYVIGKYGLPFVFTSGSGVKNATIDVYDDIADAKSKVSYLSRTYRRDDVWHSPDKKSRQIRKFYLVKVDSPKFPVKLKNVDEKRTGRRESSKAYFFVDKYGESDALGGL